MDKRRRRNEEGREKQTGEMRELEMGGRERAGHSFPFSPWFSVRVAQEDKAKRSVSLLWNNPFCVSPLSLSLSLKILPFSLSNGTTQISSDASCDMAHLWWHGLLTSLVQYNTLSSYKAQTSPKSNAKVKFCKHLRLFLFHEQTFNMANIQTSVIY